MKTHKNRKKNHLKIIFRKKRTANTFAEPYGQRVEKCYTLYQRHCFNYEQLVGSLDAHAHHYLYNGTENNKCLFFYSRNVLNGNAQYVEHFFFFFLSQTCNRKIRLLHRTVWTVCNIHPYSSMAVYYFVGNNIPNKCIERNENRI